MDDPRYIAPELVLGRRLESLGLQPPDWDVALLSFRGREASQLLVECFDARPLDENLFVSLGAFPEIPLVYEAERGGTSVGIVTRCIWGGPQTSLLMESLAYFGVKLVLGYGAAGSLVSQVRIGTQTVATAGLITDGTSRQYAPEGTAVQASERLYSALDGAGSDAPPHPVTAATVDAFYRETETLLAAYREAGAEVVNMETSPMYAAARACGMEALWLGHVSDSLVDGAWEHAGFSRLEQSKETAAWCRRVVDGL